MSLFADADDVRVLTKLVNRGVLALLGSVVGVLSVIFGLFAASVLILRVIVAVMRDGLN